MDALKFSTLSRMLSQHGEDLQFKADNLFERVYNYWNKSQTLNSKIKFSKTADGLEIVIPQCDFHCYGESRIRFYDSKPVNEITFFTKGNDKKLPFVVFRINQDNELSVPGNAEAPIVDLDYARSVEEYFMNELIMAASKASLV
ncbi:MULTISPECIES: hypothetical protein [Enterobacter]|jgi:hypothetical protein|uniref:hypothetical protein n=1 Tax=Enterobacter TaxID=547 RepID=UPI0007519B75|nr:MULTISPECIES: hypothetical protein [Enterobacter]EKK5413016.1 hypothetical protein [Enterobacter cloacae]KUR03463.1 hypothetical protein AWI32_02900 [Enterobacter bugandensis]MCK7373697.1 hypothetical protein [Enterobacter bugandensis]MCM7374195.1 hypothetical protein [Enterobacter bugandensis]MEA3823912.1 hypothetical protein [Enterobacter kobei]